MDSDEVKKRVIKRIYEAVRNFLKKEWVAKKHFTRRYKFQLALGVLLVVSIAIMFIYFLCNKQADFINELGNKDKPFYIRNIAVVLAAIATAVFTWWKNTISHKTTEIQESTRQDELFAKAVDLLKRENDLITRKAGVHILKDLAVTSPKHTQKCIDMLCSLNEVWMPKFLKEYPDFFEINKDFQCINSIEEIKLSVAKSSTDQELYVRENVKAIGYVDDISLSQLVLVSVAEIVTVISASVDFEGPYNFRYKFLCGGNFGGLDFEKFSKMRNVNFRGTNLRKANLKGADLYEAEMQSVVLEESNLQNANLMRANLQSAKLLLSNLQNADLSLSNLRLSSLCAANLQHAVLEQADLQRAVLSCAKLNYASLLRALLVGAELIETDLRSTDLRCTLFQYANLSEANLQYANIEEASFLHAILEKTDFRNVDFAETAIFDNNKSMAVFADEEYIRIY